MRSRRSPTRLAVLLFGVLSTTAALAAADTRTAADRPPAGRTRSLVASRAVTAPVIDGRLIDEAWKLGVAGDGFWRSDTQRPPTDQTRVVVLYDDTALYIAFTCLDARPDLVRATQITRDASPGLDDRVVVDLDPRHGHRAVSRFVVTARGTQSDALAGGRARKAGTAASWRGAAQRAPFGWTAEIAIPFELLDFDPQTTTFGVNFGRYQNRTREWSDWADVTPRRLAEEAGHLVGLRLPRALPGDRMAVTQYVSSGMQTSATRPAEEPATGLDLRYRWNRGITSVVSARPDFSGIDADVQGLGFSHSERAVADRRPFFQEGAAFFGGRELFYSNRIEDFDLGVKTFGRLEDYQVGMLATTDAATGRADYIGRVVREVGPAFNVSAAMAGTRRAELDNNAVQLQAGGRIGRHLRVDSNLVHTSSTGDGGDGVRGRAELGYQRAHWYSAGWADRTDRDYFAANGYLAGDVAGTVGRGAYGGFNRGFGDAWLRRANAMVAYEWRDTTGGLRQREAASVSVGAETAANLQVSAGVTSGLYRPRDGSDWAARIDEDRSYLASAFYQSPTGQFGYGAQYSWGVAGDNGYDSLAPSLWLAPNGHLSVTYSFERATYDRVRRQHVVSGTWDISSAQSIAARWVDEAGGYLRLSYRRALAQSMDAFGVYTSDPYDPGRLDVKFVWSLSPLQPQATKR